MHYINRTNWLRVAIPSANDGILSLASLNICGVLPAVLVLLLTFDILIYVQYDSSRLFYMTLGTFAAHSGGAQVCESIFLIAFLENRGVGHASQERIFFQGKCLIGII